MPTLILLVGNIGSGKSTLCKESYSSFTRVSQDDQGKEGHKKIFENALLLNEDIIVDRQNNIREQRNYFLNQAKVTGYTTKIIWLRTNEALCERRVIQRQDHPSIDLKDNIRAIIKMHTKSLEVPVASEADELVEIHTKYYAPIQDLTHLKGRIAVVGDPHGTWKEIKKALDEIKPDHVVYVGDVVDRGPGIAELIDHAQQNYSVIGNHEDKLARALLGNKISISGGLDETLKQIEHYTKEQRDNLYNWIQTLPYIIKLPKSYVVVHAGFNPSRPLDKQHCDTCLYIRTHGTGKMDDTSMPPWYKYDLCSDLKQYKILFGHAIHEECEVAPNVYSLDKGAVYGTGLRIMIINTEGEDIIKEYDTPIQYTSTYTKRSPFHKKDELVKEGLLSKSELDHLVLYNYTERATFSKSFHIPEVKQSRGSIYDKKTGKLVAKAFPKYHNLNEAEESRLENLPLHLPFQAFEKMDGSLGILFRHNDDYRVSTRGSFYSEQSKRATEMLKKYSMEYCPRPYTLLFEIIYPENRIVVDYGDKKELVLLAVYNYETGAELPFESLGSTWEDSVTDVAKRCGFSLPKAFNHTLEELIELAKSIPFQEEGWVLRFENGLRVKIKGADYLRIAKIKSCMSPLSFWEAMMVGKAEEYLVSIPEELRPDAEAIYDTLKKQLNTLKDKVQVEIDRLGLVSSSRDKDELKRVALEIQKCPEWMRGYLFQVMRGRPSDDLLLKGLRPTDNTYTLMEKFE